MERGEIGVGLVGYKFMGRAHSNAYRQVASFFDVDPVPRMAAICGRDEAGVREAADTLGWDSYETDYRKLIARDDIDLVDVVTPGNTHREIVLTALEAGKHVLCEKPLANNLSEAREMLRRGPQRGDDQHGLLQLQARPAVQLARKLVEEGRLGEIRHWRATYLQDFIMDPSFPLIWRLKKEVSGSGRPRRHRRAHHRPRPLRRRAYLRGHGHDGDVRRGAAPGGASAGGGSRRAVEPRWGEVTVDDAAAFLARFENGAIGTFEATRFAAGRRNQNSFEVNGSEGKRRLRPGADERARGVLYGRRRRRPGLPDRERDRARPSYTGAWWPPGHILGYEHTFIHTMKDLMDGIKAGKSPAPTFEDGYRCQAVLDAVERSAASGEWRRPQMEGI